MWGKNYLKSIINFDRNNSKTAPSGGQVHSSSSKLKATKQTSQ